MSTAQTEREGKGEKRGVSELCLYIGRGGERGFFAAPPLSPILCDKKPSRFLTCAPPPPAAAGAKEKKIKMMVKQTAACCIQVASLSYEGFFFESRTVRSVSAPACSMGLSLPVQNSDNRQLGGGGGGRGPISYLPATYTKLYPPNGRGGVGF